MEYERDPYRPDADDAGNKLDSLDSKRAKLEGHQADGIFLTGQLDGTFHKKIARRRADGRTTHC